MKDRERLLALLQDWGITPQEHRGVYDGEPTNSLLLEAGEGGVAGYPGFVCTLSFAEDGSFKGVGVWE